MDILQFIFENLNKLGVGESSDFLVFLGLSFLVGIVVLTWRYSLNFKDHNERENWNKENLLNKIIISVLIGSSSIILVWLSRLIFIEVNPIEQPSPFNFTWILLATLYSVIIISSKSDLEYLKIIRETLKLTWELIFQSAILLIILLLIVPQVLSVIIFIIGALIIMNFADKRCGGKLIRPRN